MARFTAGNPGKPRGAKKKKLAADVKRLCVSDNADELLRVLKSAFKSSRRSEQRWAADQIRRMLPRDEAITVNGGSKPFFLIVGKTAAEIGPPEEIRPKNESEKL